MSRDKIDMMTLQNKTLAIIMGGRRRCGDQRRRDPERNLDLRYSHS
jgi:hypothetical protein